MASTTKCIICGANATHYGGHLHHGYQKIIAGFCEQHFSTKPTIDSCKGCYGEWKEEMGVDANFGRLSYIDLDGIHPTKEALEAANDTFKKLANE